MDIERLFDLLDDIQDEEFLKHFRIRIEIDNYISTIIERIKILYKDKEMIRLYKDIDNHYTVTIKEDCRSKFRKFLNSFKEMVWYYKDIQFDRKCNKDEFKELVSILQL